MGGRPFDKHTTENCGILDKRPHGNVVLTDRGTGRNMSKYKKMLHGNSTPIEIHIYQKIIPHLQPHRIDKNSSVHSLLLLFCLTVKHCHLPYASKKTNWMKNFHYDILVSHQTNHPFYAYPGIRNLPCGLYLRSRQLPLAFGKSWDVQLRTVQS